MKILITGGAGYIGSRLATVLTSHGHQVAVLDDLSAGTRRNLPTGVTFHHLDIRSPELSKLMRRLAPVVVFHLAASKSVNESINHPKKFQSINVGGSQNVIGSAKSIGVKRLIFTSTAGVYGDPLSPDPQLESDLPRPSSPYALTKLTTEQYLLSAHQEIEGIVLRFANVYGPGGVTSYESAVNIFVKRILSHSALVVHGDGTQTRDLVYIDDLIQACINTLTLDLVAVKEPPIFNISTGHSVSINQLIKLIMAATQVTVPIDYQSMIYPGQKSSVLSPEKARRYSLLPNQTSLAEGLRQTIKHYAKH